MGKELVKVVEYSSPVYVTRYYHTSGETAQKFNERPNIHRWRGECKDTKEDDIYKWLNNNAVTNLDPYNSKHKIHGNYLLMGENGTLCNVILNIEQESLQQFGGAPISDYVTRHHLKIRCQPASKEIPTELIKALEERDYIIGNHKIDKKLMTHSKPKYIKQA